jgi:hypothetical protein
MRTFSLFLSSRAVVFTWQLFELTAPGDAFPSYTLFYGHSFRTRVRLNFNSNFSWCWVNLLHPKMFSKLVSAFIVPGLLVSSLVQAQAQVDLTSVGPATPLSSKSTICNVLDYGAVADNSTDIGPAIEKAFSSCASSGGATIYIPPGTYSCEFSLTP